MRMTRELVLCALHRAGEPVDTGTLLALVCDLAVQGGWPARVVAEWSAKALPPMLRGMLRDQLVFREAGTERWLPRDAFDACRDIPAPPAADGKDAHELDGLTRSQLITVFEVQSESLARLLQLCDAHLAENVRFAEQMDGIRTAARRRLYSVGLGERVEAG